MEIYKLSDEIPDGKNNSDSCNLKKDELKITDIKQAVKNENRVNIFVNGKYSFSLDIAQVVELKIKVGLKISEEDLGKYKRASDFGKLYQRTLEWVLIRPRSVRETRDYLNKKLRNILRGPFATNEERVSEVSPVTTGRNERVREDYSEFLEDIICKLSKKGYVDDRKFAEYYVENRFVKKGISRRRLEQELIKKGVAREIIDEVLNARNDEEEILKMIAKKRGKYDDDKLISYLCRQGFDYQQVQNLVRTYEKD